MIEFKKITGVCAIRIDSESDFFCKLKNLEKNLYKFSQFRLIIVFNGVVQISNFDEYIHKKFGKNRKLRFYLQPFSNLSHALNYGVVQAKTPWVFRFDFPEIFNEAALLHICRDINFDLENIVYSWHNDSYEGQKLHIFNPKLLFVKNIVSHPGVIFSRNLFFRVGGYLGPERAQDLSLWVRMLDINATIILYPGIRSWAYWTKNRNQVDRSKTYRSVMSICAYWIPSKYFLYAAAGFLNASARWTYVLVFRRWIS